MTGRTRRWGNRKPAYVFGLSIVGLSAPCPILAQEISQPLIINAPATQQIDAPDAIAVRAGATAVYDSNILRRNVGRSTGNSGNVRVTPTIEVLLNRRLGRYLFSADGSAGYDLNTRFSELNRVRLNLNGRARMPLGGRCAVTPQATYQRFQTDLGDLQVLRGNTTEFQNYTIGIACPRRTGFTPNFSVNQNTGKNSNVLRELLDYRSRGVTAGLSYYRPSLGTVSLNGSYRRIERPNLIDQFGIRDATKVKQLGVVLDRSVSTRLSATAGLSILRIDPDRAAVRSYSGIGYNADIVYRPVPRAAIVAHLERDARGQSSVNATYVLADVYRLSGNWALTARSSVDVGLAHDIRRFRGEGLVPGFQARGVDRTDAITGRYNYDIRQRWRLSVFASYRTRNADNDLFDYSATSVGISASTRL